MRYPGIMLTAVAVLFLVGALCAYGEPALKARRDAIPASAVKMTPATDSFPPICRSDRWKQPVPMPGPVNTAGAEDSPFMAGDRFYFVFIPDVNQPPVKQLTDGASGLWCSRKVKGKWTEPERVLLSDSLSLDGAAFVQGDTMWFASVRMGNYTEVDMYTARFRDGKWTDVRNAGEQLNKDYDIGEMHIAPDGKTMYCGGPENWGDFKGKDLYMLKKSADGWSKPVALPFPINTKEKNEDQPFITRDGRELWFTGESRLGSPGPSVFRCVKRPDGSWGDPEEIISSFAGEPTLDDKGNIYFVHHFFTRQMKMIEADIYVAYRK